MIEVRDTFLHFIADNLSAPVHYMVYDPSDMSGSNYKANAVNIEYHNESPKVGIGQFVVCLDVIYDSELTALPVMKELFKLLTASGMAPLYDYSGDAPVSQGCNIYWDVRKIQFKRLQTDNFFRRSCTLSLYTHIS